MERTKLLKLGIRDIVYGFLIAIVTAILIGVNTEIEQGNFELSMTFFKPIILSGIAAGFTYLLKNWLSNSKGQMLTKEKDEPVG